MDKEGNQKMDLEQVSKNIRTNEIRKRPQFSQMKNTVFDESKWNRDAILEAFKSLKKYDMLRKRIAEIINDIKDCLSENLPYNILVSDRRYLKELAIALRYIYKFGLLPEEYIEDERQYLLASLKDLKEEVRNLFPIMSRVKLRGLKNSREKLKKYYYVIRTLSTYFELPLEKEPLSNTHKS
ncbi:43697_t:CDS:2 [Gigaspora margarita]|uniref:43697_t:CDS:1 n=1 Tax=Gigaspora margarita TaxID=4874 RepID=A0ABN7VKR9_GIGMA|nr:43697_t:CDS:2 [Gigaspora margarita]